MNNILDYPVCSVTGEWVKLYAAQTVHECLKAIKEDAWFAVGILYPISHHLLLNPMIAAAAMSFSPVSVVSNGLILRVSKLT